MKYLVAVAALGAFSAGGWGLWTTVAEPTVGERVSDHEAEFEGEYDAASTEVADMLPPALLLSTTATSLPPIPEPQNEEGRTRWAAYWEDMTPLEYAVYGPRERAPGPARVGIQVGHWQRENLPEELSGLAGSSGAVAGGVTETEVNLAVAERVVARLVAAGVEAELLPVTVPVDYLADAFVTIHADGSSNSGARGYKIAPPRRDFSGRAAALVAALEESYAAATGLPHDTDGVTRRMSGYYAFNWRRYDHAVHPQTPAAIVEMGFLTNGTDRAFIVNEADKVAAGIAEGVLKFLRSKGSFAF